MASIYDRATERVATPAPAASMDGSVFMKAAVEAGLPTDRGTLNKIVRLVNQGYSPATAATVVKNGTGG